MLVFKQLFTFLKVHCSIGHLNQSQNVIKSILKRRFLNNRHHLRSVV